ncbi:MAG: hypothetical protein M3Y39_10725 [Chloroflexota bacterium]|nr:hypothetical protein [Chloroflexota bacterium]
MLPQDQNDDRLRTFLSLGWYEEAIKFVFNFVTKTSELLLAAGVVVSTANFLTDGDVMGHSKLLSDAWSWAQALAIDSSLGIVFMNAFQSVQEREKIKAVIFFTLTALLATVAGLITHFDALSHAAGLPVTDKGISGIIPLWVMTALRAVAVIGFLLASRLKNLSFNALRQERNQASVVPKSMQPEPVVPALDYTTLATALVEAMKHAGARESANVLEKDTISLPSPVGTPSIQQTRSSRPQQNTAQEEPAASKIAHAYKQLFQERAEQHDDKPISARDLAKRANLRRSTCSEWLQQQNVTPPDLEKQQEELAQDAEKEEESSSPVSHDLEISSE